MASDTKNRKNGEKKQPRKKGGELNKTDPPQDSNANNNDTATRETPLSDDDLPPFLRNMRGKKSSQRERSSDAHQNNSNPDPWHDPKEDGNSSAPQYSQPIQDTVLAEKHESFWNKFKPSLIGVRKRGLIVQKSTGADNAFLTKTIFLILILLLAFTVLQQVSSGGIRWMTATALLFTVPYIIMLVIEDLKAYWNLDEENPRGFRSRINKLLGPGIVSVAVSSCIFSAPLEGRVWIVGGETTGTYSALVRIPVFKKITSIPHYQEVVMDVSGKTADGVMVNARISVPVICCDDAQADNIIAIYGTPKEKPEILIQRYLNGIFDNAFKQAAGSVKVVNIRSAYASMAKSISKKQIRQTSTLIWKGTFTIIDSRADLPKN